MSLAIKVENLGKKYVIRTSDVRKDTMREVIIDTLKSPFTRLARRTGESPDDETFWALKEVSFDVHQGDVVGIIGRNGAGKSTLLKILSKIVEPTEGCVKIRGRISSLLEVGTGFHPELTGRENIYLNGAIIGMTRAEISRKFDEIVAFSEIEKFLDTPVKRYSSGMYVRLAFAVAAHLEPEILIVDEVLAVGDTAFQKKCLGKMGDVGKEGRTVLFVSHNMAAINALCNDSIWLDKGRFWGAGKTDEVVRNYLSATGNVGADIRHAPPASARVALTRVWISSSDGDISSSLDINKPFNIHIEFEVRKKTTDIDIGVWIRNAREVPVCFTNLSDMNGGELPVLLPGSYGCSFQVPALFFVPDCYRLSVKAHVHNVTTEDFIRDAGEFRLEDTGSLQGRYIHAWRHGVVLGHFDWKVSRA